MAQLKMFGASTGWAVQRHLNGPLSENKILHTTNGLGSWTNVTPAGPAGYYVDLTAAFFDAHLLEAVDKSTLFYTKDGGHSWAKVEPQIAP
jgi:photosystem II stability/assembly factor-like uncharacterized protein